MRINTRYYLQCLHKVCTIIHIIHKRYQLEYKKIFFENTNQKKLSLLFNIYNQHDKIKLIKGGILCVINQDQ